VTSLASSLSTLLLLGLLLAVPLGLFGILPFLVGRFFVSEKFAQTFLLRVLVMLLIVLSGWITLITYKSLIRAYPISEVVNVSQNNIPQLFIPYISLTLIIALPILILSKRLPLLTLASPILLSMTSNLMITNIGNHVFYNIEERHYHFYDKIYLSPTLVGICGTLMLIAYFLGISIQKRNLQQTTL